MRIANFGQVVDLERGGQFTHQITVIAEDGRRFSVNTDQATVQQLV